MSELYDILKEADLGKCFQMDFSHVRFDGDTYEPDKDQVRLGKQAQRCWDAIQDGKWRTLSELSEITGDPEASISARLRDFRKERFGGHDIPRRRRSCGQWEYRLEK